MKFCEALNKLAGPSHRYTHMFRKGGRGGPEIWLGETNVGVLRKTTLDLPGNRTLSEADLNADDWDLSEVPF